MARYLAIVERRLGVQFPDSYVTAIRSGALSRWQAGELYPPNECHWLDDYGDTTWLVIGMHQRGDARPLVMRRTGGALDDAIFVARGNAPEQIAASLPELVAKS